MIWHEISREEIHWHPEVVSERCIGCGLYVTSCGRGVFTFNYETNRPVVAKEMMCMVGCTTCATICTRDAIEFPGTGYIRQIIGERKVINQSKEMIKSQQVKYQA